MKTFFKVLKGIIFAILGIILCLNIFIIIESRVKPNQVPGLFGYKPFVVLSGSMQPNIMTGDLVIIKEVDVNTLKENDIIAFRDNENLVTTHRITKVVKENDNVCFETKGDSNNVIDENLACKNNIEGKFVKRFPLVGNVIIFIQQPMGFTIMMLTILIICIIIFVIDNKKIVIENDEERKAFEEFKKAQKNKQSK